GNKAKSRSSSSHPSSPVSKPYPQAQHDSVRRQRWWRGGRQEKAEQGRRGIGSGGGAINYSGDVGDDGGVGRG
ncbi:unnamed protein product, partial [Linum tenue]